MPKKDYYDYDIDMDMPMQGCEIEDLFILKDIPIRKFYLNYGVDQPGVHAIARHILQINAEDRGIPVEDRQPILIYIISEGGDVDSGFELIDVIECSETPVYTINIGYQYSMGFLIGLAGHKRYATKNAKFLMHDGSKVIWDSSCKVEDQMEFHKLVESRIKDYVVSHSKLTPEEYDAKRRIEWYMFAEEAKEKGFTDYIIGVDCDIGEIV